MKSIESKYRYKHNNAVNSDAFSIRFAHYKCAGYGQRWAS